MFLKVCSTKHLGRFLRYQRYSGATSAVKSSQEPKPFSDIPQPKGLPLIGTFLDRTPIRNFDSSSLYEYFKNRHQALGTIYKESLAGQTTVCTSSPSDTEALHRAEGKWPERPKLEVLSRGRQLSNMNEGIVNTKGEEWHRVRKLFNEHLLTNKTVWMYAQQHLEVSFDLMDFIKQNLNEKKEVPDFEYLLYCWGLECATVFVMDSRLHAFRTDLPDHVKAVIDSTADLFKIWTELMYSIPTWKHFNNKQAKKLKLGQETQLNALKQFVNITGKGKKSRLESLVAESNLSSSEKEVIVSDILGAGIDTTSNAASFLLYCLATNPDKQETLRQEVQKVLSTGQEINGKTLQQMKYLHAVNMEAQRLFPLAIGTSRIISTDMVFSGYHVPAGTSVILTGNLMNNRDPKFFKDPDSFIPERWLDRNKENRFVISGSFGSGARMCPGRRFALQEVGCLTMALLARYKIEYHYEPFEMIFRMVSKPAQKPNFTFVPIEA